MDSLFILIPIALLFVAIAIKALMWAVENRQYDDLDAAASSILFDDDVQVNFSPQLKPGTPCTDSGRGGGPEQKHGQDAGKKYD